MTDPTARTEILPAACLVCGEQERACECASFRTELESAARLLRRAGFAAARSGRLHEAHHLMEQAVELDGRCAVSWQALGLCCLALGSITQARLAWACAAHLDPQCDAAKYLEDLSHGFVAAALRRYNRAIEAARRGQWSDALRQLQPVRRSLPDFLPAGRLSGLVLESSGDAEAARQVWLEYLALAHDDMDLLRLTAASDSARASARTKSPRSSSYRLVRAATGLLAVLVLATGLVLLRLSKGPAAGPTLPRAEDSPVRQVPAGLGIPTARDSEGGSALLAPQDSPLASEKSVEPPPELGPELAALNWDFAWRLFQAARRDTDEGSWDRALPQLILAADLSNGRFYHDDILYLLARAYARAQKPDRARAVAQQLIAAYPTSIFVNSVTRKIAETGREP